MRDNHVKANKACRKKSNVVFLETKQTYNLTKNFRKDAKSAYLTSQSKLRVT